MDAIQRFLQIRRDHFLVLVTPNLGFEVEIIVDVFFSDPHKRFVAQLAFRAFKDQLQPPQSPGIFIEKNIVASMKLIDDVLDEKLVKVVAAKLCVAVTGFDFDDAGFDHDDRDIESATTQVIDEDPFVAGMARVVGEHSGSWLVNDANDFEVGEGTGILRGFSLVFVKECRHGNYGFLRQVGPRIFLPRL